MRHYAVKTEKAYVQWILRYVAYHHDRHVLKKDVGDFSDFPRARRLAHDLQPTSGGCQVHARVSPYSSEK